MVPPEVTQALSDMADDGMTVAVAVVVALIAVKAAKFLSLAISRNAASSYVMRDSDSVF